MKPEILALPVLSARDTGFTEQLVPATEQLYTVQFHLQGCAPWRLLTRSSAVLAKHPSEVCMPFPKMTYCLELEIFTDFST